MTEHIRVGLIGCGGIGKLRAAAMRRCRTVKLCAVTDKDPDRARSVSKKFGGTVVSDWHHLIRTTDLDAIVVSTPPDAHAEMSIAALEYGKHVLCEKPLARSSNECQKILDAAEQNGRFVATGFNYRFYPSVQKAQELLNSGLIGDLDHIRSYAGYSAKQHNHAWLHDAEIMGGGALRDNGIHLIDLTLHFLGDVVEVKGFSRASVWGFDGCEDNGFLLMRNAKGNIASLQASWTEWRGYRFSIEVYGTHGCIRTSCFPMITQVSWSSGLGGKMRRKTHFFPMVHLREHLQSYEWVVTESFVRELEAFARAIHGEDSMIATGFDGLRAVEIAEEAAGCPVADKGQDLVLCFSQLSG